MKHWLLSVICLIQFSLTLPAQTFHGGLLLGIVASQVDGDTYAGYDKMGLTGGVFVSTRLTDIIDARMEIRYASRGAKNPASDDHTGYYNLTLHYIDIPVLAELRIKKIGYIEAGLCPGYKFAAHGEDDAGDLPAGYLQEIHRFDMGLLFGLQILLTPKLSFLGRYTYSVFSIRNRETAGSYYSWLGKIFGNPKGDFNNYLTFGLSYRIK